MDSLKIAGAYVAANACAFVPLPGSLLLSVCVVTELARQGINPFSHDSRVPNTIPMDGLLGTMTISAIAGKTLAIAALTALIAFSVISVPVGIAGIAIVGIPLAILLIHLLTYLIALKLKDRSQHHAPIAAT